ncbi:head-tail connector protein [Alcaligenes endophyticus]|uniref:Head-tail connector protein n=1 Tax=Alcaligenes endophyticus TaxID=1929088 RepID=A0ABT8ENK1_9BURK|nr:head-tail connector protein [Alcaligenes endophyticus]MCX5592802.1 head-tail connector protein [Alcaligenes endophyticus]MDN4122844.1 head-tail connector protein [Alcaligenes endophyticus]
MAVIALESAKAFLDVIHDADDTKLQMLLDGAIDGAERFIGRKLEEAAAAEGNQQLPANMVVGVMLFLQADYQASPDDAPKLRAAAEIKLKPYRKKWEDS